MEVESEQALSPAKDSPHEEDLDLDKWRKNIRACVTALKCHIMASKGLTAEGNITETYSPEILLKEDYNKSIIKEGNKEEIDKYIVDALSRIPYDAKADIDLKDVELNIDHDTVDNATSVSSPLLNESLLNMSGAENCKEESNSTKNVIDSSISQYISHENLTSGTENYHEVNKVKEELGKKSREIEKLSKIRDEVENELQDLTANLFQEAHSMVQSANQRAAIAEKSYKEASMQVEVLQAEVDALKALVITSTPSTPNPHLHPQIIQRGAQAMVAEAGKIFHRGHKKSPSDFDLKYGRDTTPPSSPLKDGRIFDPSVSSPSFPLDPECWEVDPVLHREFVAWRETPQLTRSNAFMNRVYSEDIDLCLSFPNSTLAHKVQKAIEDNLLSIEEVNPRQTVACPKKCVLLDVPRYCKYRFRLGDKENTWYYISQLARNRIISVCDFLSYLRYIQLGLVKNSIHDVYWEIVKLRRQMALARLGF